MYQLIQLKRGLTKRVKNIHQLLTEKGINYPMVEKYEQRRNKEGGMVEEGKQTVTKRRFSSISY